MKLTVYYDGQFWVGVFEETCDTKLRACRYVFGPEPMDIEILDVVNRKMLDLLNQTKQPLPTEAVAEESLVRKFNPKRLARLTAAEMSKTGISTKAQQALKLEHEIHKKEQALLWRQQKDALEEIRWERKREKAKAKHRGR